MRRQVMLPLLLLSLQLSICSLVTARDAHADHDLMPGWLGSDYQPPQLTPDLLAGRTRRMKVIHEDARIYLFEGFLTPEECDEIKKKAEPRLVRSNVVVQAKSDATHSTQTEPSKIRTSHGMFFARGENAVIKTVEERIAAWTLLPVHNGEGLQVLRYENTQKYEPHWDYFFHQDGISNGGNRYATVLTYLSDVEEGGETIFPFIPAPIGENKNASECARKYLSVKPKKGDAVLFHSIQPNGAFEKRSMHGSCPVINGTKWSMAKWIHVGRYAVGSEPRLPIEQTPNPAPKPRAQGDCKDMDERCEMWSTRGECYKNELWMVGDADGPGHCMAACQRCDVWKAHLEKQKGLKVAGTQGGAAGAVQKKR